MLKKIAISLFLISSVALAENWVQYGDEPILMDKSSYMYNKTTKTAYVKLKTPINSENSSLIYTNGSPAYKISFLEFKCEKQKICLLNSKVYSKTGDVLSEADNRENPICEDLEISDNGRAEYARFCIPYISGI